MKIIIVGGGKAGATLANALVNEGHDVTIIDHKAERIAELCNNNDMMGLVGNGMNYSSLSDAGTVAQQPVGDTQLAGTRVRQLFGLRSAAFAVTYAEGQFTFAVHGYGHGVGMSQYGADYLARQGYTYEEILHYYYTDVTVNSPK